jgi:hypothetical protein
MPSILVDLINNFYRQMNNTHIIRCEGNHYRKHMKIGLFKPMNIIIKPMNIV